MGNLLKPLAAIFVVFSVTACEEDWIDILIDHEDPADETDAVICEYNGEMYEVGESFPDKDGCNSCTCTEEGDIACTMMECIPNECANPDSAMIVAAEKSFGMCAGDCRFILYIAPAEGTDCMNVTLDACEWVTDECKEKNTGVLTPLGQAEVFNQAEALADVELQEVYGCPDCADGGASQLTLRVDGEDISVSYEYYNPPDVLQSADAFVQGLLNTLNSCESNEYVTVSNTHCEIVK